ncbi:hypothetical protein [Candidatus Tokpelaia sp.]|uniref:hypothetical protein n=1 Tax=Candidatus Tokpelaia sp. TaxID=2233777 RepID=UPI00123B186D|nr:hypothetical protein [Candidatus Tokpelaia sp.]
MRGKIKKPVKADAVKAHEKAVAKLLQKSRAVLADSAPEAQSVNALPDLKSGRRGVPAGDTIPAGGGYAKDMFHAYKWKKGKEERTDTIVELERKRKKVRYSFRKEGKMYGFDPFK